VIWIVTVAGMVAFCVGAQVNLQRLWSAFRNARKHKGLPPQNKMQIAPIPDTLIFGWDKSDLHFFCNRNVAWAALPVSIFVTVTIVGAFCALGSGQFAKALVGL
jgi:hypothetical protein